MSQDAGGGSEYGLEIDHDDDTGGSTRRDKPADERQDGEAHDERDTPDTSA